MINKILKMFSFIILIVVFATFTTSCKNNKKNDDHDQITEEDDKDKKDDDSETEDKNNPGDDDENVDTGEDENPVLDPVEEYKKEIAELLVDEEGATLFRVYFNLLDGTKDYKVATYEHASKIQKPDDPYREDHIFIDWYQDYECTIPFDFKRMRVDGSMMIYAKFEEFIFPDYSYLLEELLPDETTEDILLPRVIQDNDDILLTWSSSDPYTISTTGKVNQGREDITVTLDMEVYYSGVCKTFSKDVVVKRIYFSPLRENKTIFGYYSSWNYKGLTEDVLKCDVINTAFGYVTKELDVDAYSVLAKGFLDARKQGVRVVLSIKDDKSNTIDGKVMFSIAAKTEENRKTLANNIANLLETAHFDGVDIDWEYPGDYSLSIGGQRDAEALNYKLLMMEIYNAVKAKNPDYLVTTAIPGGAEGYKRFNINGKFGPVDYLDFLHIMTYDMEASSRIYHHTALKANVGKATGTDAGVMNSFDLYEMSGVPKSKLVAGIAFYGKMATPASPYKAGTFVTGGATNNKGYSTITYTMIKKNFIDRIGNGVEYYYDKECNAPYLYDVNSNTFVTYDNETSIIAKCRYVLNTYGGVMIWELGEDQTGTLMSAVREGLRRK